jgi:hypothetical protein
VSLNCLVLGETSFDKSFSVDISKENRVDDKLIELQQLKIHHLKKLILKEKDNFSNDLNLWKVDIKQEDGCKLKDVSTEKDVKQELSGNIMTPSNFFTDYFDQPPTDRNVHIIVVSTTGKYLPTFYLLNKNSLFFFHLH